LNFDKVRSEARRRWERFDNPARPRILVGAGTCGRAAGAVGGMEALRGELKRHSIEADIHEVGCLGLCYAEPLMEFSRNGAPRILYSNATAENVPRLVEDYFVRGVFDGEGALAVMGSQGYKGVPTFTDLPMMAGQVRIVSRNCGLIDPQDINHYIARDGYAGLAAALEMTGDEVIETVRTSGLRGRGGAGFPTALKWGFCREAPGDEKYMICNADEGDPGAFMDRAVIESDPHTVIEGMTIAAYAIGAARGYIYVRAEYPLAITRLERAIADAEALGLLGEGILGSDFSFHIKLKKGAGAFVCGEETALLASIEGRRGTPRPRPPFPAQKGLYGKPTNINNVETLSNVPVILARGGEWFAQYGTENSRGTKTFALAGKVVRTGLIEVPMGITLGQIVNDIGGGIPDGRKIKAVQSGGPSGGCIPASLLDMPVDYERLAEAGSIMGSGGLVVMDEDTCMVDIARYFVEFTASESCGKCAPCRLGTRQMLSILKRITNGDGRIDDLDTLREIAEAMKEGALCGLGQTAPNPVLTTIRYFEEEYRRHIIFGNCPAAACRGIVKAACRHTCPAGVDVPRYIRYIAAGRYRDAVDVIRERLPFPGVCGRICYHPCEAKCRRGQLDEPLAVRALKRFAVEHGTPRRRRRPDKREPTGKRVAVVGSGPAGLTAAYYLARLGHKVQVFEKEAEPGGTLRTGIPAFRLPREVIDRDIKEIRKAGVRIRTKSTVRSVERLFKRGYDAVILAYGARKGLVMDIPGAREPGVTDLISFLREVNIGSAPDVGRHAFVIGGGSSAMDAARTALRLGAEDVTVMYRRSREEMPAAEEEVEEAIEEGVNFEFLAAPVEIVRNEGPPGARLAMRCIRMEPGPYGSDGRQRPVPVEGSDFTVDADMVIMAIGQKPEEIEVLGCDTDRRGRVVVDEVTLATSRPGVFAAGDVVMGPASVIEAVAASRRVAAAVDRYLGGDGDIDEALAPVEDLTGVEMLEEDEARPRLKVPRRPPSEAVGDFREVELGFTEEAALEEANRCLRCDLEEYED